MLFKLTPEPAIGVKFDNKNSRLAVETPLSTVIVKEDAFPESVHNSKVTGS